jgi:dTDP-4-dehydrorhamnose 3,5-epimerase
METYKTSEWAAFGVKEPFVQDNHSHSTRGTLRGLHFQKPPAAQAKLVRVIQGEIFDLAVDIRKGSPSYGQWVGATLSSENKQMLYIPVGFAHGFCVTSETAEVLYKVTADYSPEHEDGMIWNDPEITVPWPIRAPILSRKDESYPHLKNMETPFIWKGTV